MGQSKRKIQGCRDFIDGIDELIRLRISQYSVVSGGPLAGKGYDESEEDIELLKRDLVDEFRKHSGAKGIYVEPRNK